LGVSRNVNGRRVPHFQLVVGGELRQNGGAYGLALGAIPSKRVPDAVERLTRAYGSRKLEGETFKKFVERVGKKEIKSLIEELTQVPPYEQDPSYYSDWGDPREYTIGDMGVGECAGEVVPFVQFGLAKSELEVFEAQVLLDEGKPDDAARRAYSAMLQAARALAKEKNANLGEEPEEIVREFKQHWVETKLFWDPFAGAKFAQYLFKAYEDGQSKSHSAESAHQLIEEAQLFVDAAHQAHTRIGTAVP
jgi:sulfite reductase (ferredoxin)